MKGFSGGFMIADRVGVVGVKEFSSVYRVPKKGAKRNENQMDFK
jgi:hypothetical protein